MKYLSILIVLFGLCLSACNNNDEPPVTTYVPIVESYLPATIIFDKSDTEFREKLRGWNNKKVIVNSVGELPNDPLGFPESYSKISYSNYTLLLYYQIHDYDILSCQSRIVNNKVEEIYDWTISLGINGELNPGELSEPWAITRYAVLINKTPVDESNLKISIGLTDHNFDWDK